MILCKTFGLKIKGGTIMTNVLQEQSIGNMHIIKIKKDLTMEEYKKIKKSICCRNIKLNVLWNSQKQCINKGTLFTFYSEENLYNIFLSDSFYKIDECHQANKICEEKILMVYPMNKEYSYTLMKHDQIGSTFFIRSFSNMIYDSTDFDLSAKEAFQGIQQIIGNLLCVAGIEYIINWSEFYEIVYADIASREELTL